MTDKIIVQKDGGVGHIRLNQPEKHNAISYEMWQGMA
ncbi:MAG: enoyl-CoA hydratase, partial [Gemmatimonadota bacterium]|nr:enoyl-CoA hydratase [Gemmatimonadota bacterium]